MWKPVCTVLLVIAIILNIAKVHCDDNITREGCGWRNPGGVGVLLQNDDKQSNFGEFPWLVALLNVTKINEKDATLNVYFGGGSLIHPRVVLTGAHLLVKYRPETLLVRAGEWDATSKKEVYPHQDRSVESMVIHEKYEKANYTHNIALLFLSEPMELAPNVGLACLPRSQQKPQPGTKCIFAGWGKDKLKGHYSTIPKKVEMPFVSREDCQNKFRTSRLGNWFELHDTFMCAGEESKFTCKGDGGSPLVCPTEAKDRYVQNGIATWGINCDGKMPSVFSDVAGLRDWVDDKVKEKGFEISTYSNY